MYTVYCQSPGDEVAHQSLYPTTTAALRVFERRDAHLGGVAMLWLQNAQGEVLVANDLYLRLVLGRLPRLHAAY